MKNITERFINLTSRDLVLSVLDKDVILPRSERIAAVSFRHISYQKVGELIIENQQYSGIRNLPDPQDGIFYIVPPRVAEIIGSARNDILTPDPTTFIRTKSSGKIGKVERLIRLRGTNGNYLRKGY